MGAIISIYLDNRNKKTAEAFLENGTRKKKTVVYPLKIRATYQRKRIYIGIPKNKVNTKLDNSILEQYRYNGSGNYSIDEHTFDKAMEAKPRGVYKELQYVFKAIELDAQAKADSLEHFTFDSFKALLGRDRLKVNKVFIIFQQYIDDLQSSDRIGTADSYRDAKTSLLKFAKDANITFEYFTKERLEKYQKWMTTERKSITPDGTHKIEKGNSLTTVGMYLRALRAVFNYAIAEGITTHYPFTRLNKKEDNKYRIPKGGGRKIALGTAELKKLFNYQSSPDNPHSFYLDMWKCLFYLGGLNPTDLCLLKESNIQNGFIFYTRQKTKRTSNEQKVIQVPYSEEVDNIISRWRKPKKKESFLLPVLDSTMDSTTQNKKIAQFVKMINSTMKHVAAELKIDKKITTYVARHSIATQLLRSGASVKLIGDQLGHHSTNTTEQYLNGFEDEQINEAYKNAIKF